MANLGGRPKVVFLPKYCKMAFQLSLLGATNDRMAAVFNISESTLDMWKRKYPRFLRSIQKGKEEADAKVAASLYDKALGYTRTVVEKEIVNGVEKKVTKKVYYPPETVAATFWLKNRQKQEWRDRQDIDHTSGGRPLKIGVVTYGDSK